MLPTSWGCTAGPPQRQLHALFLLAGLLVAGVSADSRAGTEAPVLALGEVRESPITAGEVQAWRVTVADAPLLLFVEQRGIDLIVEDRPAAGGEPVAVDAPNHRWGPEILLLEAPGEHRIEVRCGQSAVPPGRYALRLERVDDPRRRAAAAAMTRAGREAFGGTLERSLAAYREALQVSRELGDLALEAEALVAIADREHLLRSFSEAAEDYDRALDLWRQLGEPRRAADTLVWLGQTRRHQGKSAPARKACASAIDLWRRLGERFEEGIALKEGGLVEASGGVLEEAIPSFERARAIFQELGAPREEAKTTNSLGGVYDLQGKSDSALDFYQQALTLHQQLGDPIEEVRLLNNIGVVHRARGEWQAALDFYEQAQKLLPASMHSELELKVWLLYNLGSLYVNLGEPQRARPLTAEALALRRGDRPGEIAARTLLGQIARSQGHLDEARAQYLRALAQAEGEPFLEAGIRLRLAEVRIEQSAPQAALQDLARAVDLLNPMGRPRSEAEALYLQGRALDRAGKPEEALVSLGRALNLRQDLHDRAGLAQTLAELAAVERRLGRAAEASAHAEAAIAAVEELRSGLLSPSLRASFLATRHLAYTLRIDLLMDRHRAAPKGGFDRAALEVSERARARSLLDLIGERGSGLRENAPTELVERRRALTYLLSKEDQKERPDEKKIESLLAELDGVEADLRRLAPPGDAASAWQPRSAAAIPPLLDPGTVLLEVALGEERSYAWAVDDRGVLSAVLPAEREIEGRARKLHSDLSKLEPGGRPRTGDDLGRMLLQPVWAKVKRAQRLVVVPDASLHLIPWGVLSVPLPGQGWSARDRVPLIERAEVVEIPSATTLAAERQRLKDRPAAAKWAAVFADPVFTADDPRVSGARRSSVGRPTALARGGSPLSRSFARLPKTREEADAIAGLAPVGQVWKALDFAANREAVLGGELRRYRIVHFATHGVADTRTPELSALVLSQVDRAGRPREGFLRLTDVNDLDLAADLVVLSACETVVGREVRGEGLMGLTRGFASAGVPRVVASLWRVEDQASAATMTRFYAGMWRGRLRPAAALRAAQRALRQNPRYRDPHLWAGFVYQGDWR
jgi:CHAT domain-containing protein/tetratricopeptide (TPR) repeat protein